MKPGTPRSWRKLGKIFDPATVIFPHGPGAFAQSPQTLVLTDRVRVFYSTRLVDLSGKFLSIVSFADYSRDMSKLLHAAIEPVIDLGQLGCFDEHGIFPMNVLAHGGVVYGYTSGWSRRVSVSVETAIGLAVSKDNGRTFERVGPGPVLAASLREPFLVGDPFVRVINNVFHMWYIFGTEWATMSPGAAPDRTYRIGHASSRDGVNWQKADGAQIVSTRLANECQALPSVIEIDGLYHMFFCFRESYDFRSNPARAYRIGHAVSADLLSWTRADEEWTLNPTAREWDSDMLCYPHAFQCDGSIYLLYNGNEFGRYGFGLAVLE